MFGISLGDRNLQMSFGIGAFPFSVFGQIFSVRDVRPPARKLHYHTFVTPLIDMFLELNQI